MVLEDNTGHVSVRVFHGVMVCSGVNRGTRFPEWAMNTEYQGQVIHSLHLKSCDIFNNKTIAVIGKPALRGRGAEREGAGRDEN